MHASTSQRILYDLECDSGLSFQAFFCYTLTAAASMPRGFSMKHE
jgi:hypothetical protein